MIDVFHLVPHLGAGRGRLARHGRATLYAVADTATMARLASWCSFVAMRPGAEVMDELESLLTRADVTAVAAMVTALDGGLEMLIVGDPPVDVDGERLAGGRHRLDVVDVVELLAPAQVAIDPLLDVVQGVIASDGFTMRRAHVGPTPWSTAAPPAVGGAAAVPAAPTTEFVTKAASTAAAATPVEPPATEGAAKVAASRTGFAPPVADAAHAGVGSPPPGLVSLVGLGADLPTPQPLPVTGASGAGTGGPVVRLPGRLCAQSHFNDPRAGSCAVCGDALAPASSNLTDGVRPPLGVVTFADGSFHPVTATMVLGRDPDDDPAVRNDGAQAAVLDDPGNTISRVHAEIRPVDWDVYLLDRGSSNGTFVWNAECREWERLTPGELRLIDPGTQLSFGTLAASFDSRVRPSDPDRDR